MNITGLSYQDAKNAIHFASKAVSSNTQTVGISINGVIQCANATVFTYVLVRLPRYHINIDVLMYNNQRLPIC